MGTNPKGWRGSHPIGYLAFNLDGLTRCDVFFFIFHHQMLRLLKKYLSGNTPGPPWGWPGLKFFLS